MLCFKTLPVATHTGFVAGGSVIPIPDTNAIATPDTCVASALRMPAEIEVLSAQGTVPASGRQGGA